MKYEDFVTKLAEKLNSKNLLESAHPDEFVVVMNSDDKLNGVVGNEKFKQSVTINKLINRPTGTHNHKKYAEFKLAETLIKISSKVEQNNISLFAKDCANEIPLKKEAAPVAGIAAIALLAAYIGATYWQQSSDFINEGFLTNHEKLISEFNDLIDEEDGDANVSPELNRRIKEIIKTLNEFKFKYIKHSNTLNEFSMPRSKSELNNSISEKIDYKITEAFNDMRVSATESLTIAMSVRDKFSDEDFKSQHLKHKFHHYFLVGKNKPFADNMDDVVRAIGPYIKSIEYILNSLKNAMVKIEESLHRMENELPSEAKEDITPKHKEDVSFEYPKDITQSSKPRANHPIVKKENENLFDSIELF